MTSYSPLEALRLDIVKVSVLIDKVDQELAAAQQSGLPATDSYLRDTLLELRKKENELRKQETILLQASMPGQCDASHRLVFGRKVSQTQGLLLSHIEMPLKLSKLLFFKLSTLLFP